MDQAPSKQPLPRRTAYIMFTDIVGYSKMMSKDEAGTLLFLHEHNELLNAKIRAAGGHVIKTIGDAFMAEFPSAQATLEAAIAIQEEFHARNTGKKEADCHRIRVGIHSGEVEVQEGDLFGDAVNIAARLEPLCPPGGVHASSVTLEGVRISASWRVVKAGPQKLKNIARKVPTAYIKTPSMDPRSNVRPRKGIPPWMLVTSIVALSCLAWFAKPYVERAAERARWKEIDHIDFRKSALSDWKRAQAAWAMQTDFSAASTVDAAHFLDAHAWLRKSMQRQSAKIEIDVIVTSNNQPQLAFYLADSLTESAAVDATGTVQRAVSWKGNGLRVDWKTNAQFRTASLGENVSDTQFVPHWSVKGYLRDTAKVQRLGFILDGGYLTLVEDEKRLGTTLTRELGSAGGNEMWAGFRARNVDIISARVYVRRKKAEVGLEEAAGAYRQEGSFDLATKVYEDLVSRSDNDHDRARFLYKKAGVLRAWGHAEEFQATLEKVSSGFEPNEFTGYALFDLGYYHQEQADRGVAGASEKAEQAFQELLTKQPEHPEAGRARFTRIKNLLEHGDKHALATELAAPILADPGSIFFVDATTLLAQRSSLLADKAKFGFLSAQIARCQEFPDARIALTLVALAEHAKAQDWKGYLDLAFAMIREPLISKSDLQLVATTILNREADLTRPEPTDAQLPLAKKPKKKVSKQEAARLVAEKEVEDKRLAELKESNSKEAAEIMAFITKIEADRALAIRFFRAYIRPGGRTPGSARATDYLQKNIAVHGDDGRVQAQPKALPLDGTFAVGDPLPAAPTLMPNGRLKLRYDSGTTWGCGISVPILGKDPDDWRGFEAITFELKARQGLQVQFVLHETGAGATDLAEYLGKRGADGESYVAKSDLSGNGDWQRYTFEFKSVKPSLWWGNQTGNQTFDIQSLQGLSVQVLPNQAAGLLELRGLTLQPTGNSAAALSGTAAAPAAATLGALATEMDQFSYYAHGKNALRPEPQVQDGMKVKELGPGELQVTYDSGTDWGGDLLIEANAPDNTKAVDLRGFTKARFKFFANKGFAYKFTLHELGAEKIGLSYPKEDHKSDCEVYFYAFDLIGSGDWQDKEIDLAEMEPFKYWGNQNGNKRLDLESISQVLFSFNGGQGKGAFTFKDLRFTKN